MAAVTAREAPKTRFGAIETESAEILVNEVPSVMEELLTAKKRQGVSFMPNLAVNSSSITLGRA